MKLLQNRSEAAEKLLHMLSEDLGDDTVLLAIPRGGVPIAHVIAKALAKPIDIVMAKKIGHPVNPEYAIGAVSQDAEFISTREGIPDHYITEQIKTIRSEMEKKYEYFMGNRPSTDINGKTALILDDGIATGNSMMAALRVIQAQEPSSLIIVTPVISRDALDKFQEIADKVVYLHAPEPFISVGIHYEDFPQMTDEEVKNQLDDAYHYAKG